MHNSQQQSRSAHRRCSRSSPTSSSSYFTFVEEEVEVQCQPAVRVRHKYLGLGTPRGGEEGTQGTCAHDDSHLILVLPKMISLSSLSSVLICCDYSPWYLFCLIWALCRNLGRVVFGQAWHMFTRVSQPHNIFPFLRVQCPAWNGYCFRYPRPLRLIKFE